MNRRIFLRSTALVAGSVPWLNRGWAAPAGPADDELLWGAIESIEKHRKSDGVLVVQTAEGKPLEGATVRVEQVSHAFRFGCNLFMWGRLQDAAVEEAYRERFAALMNYATLGFYWWMYEPERGKPIYDYTDRVLEWCKGWGIECKGHPLAWDYADPKWLPRDFAEISELSHARVRDIVGRFKGRIDLWDVVNEPTHLGRFGTRLGEWAQSVGAVPYVESHLRTAREAGLGAKLLVNDYRVDGEFVKILEALQRDGKRLFDVVGLQSHMHGKVWSMGKIREVCDRFRGVGLPLHFTEATVVSGPHVEKERWKPTTPELEEAQAEYVPNLFTMLFGDPAVEALTWWDFSDRGAWQGAAAGFLRSDMSPKPVYDRLMRLVRGSWWTRARGVTDGNGEMKLRAFHGSHRVQVELANGRSWSRDVRWSKGGANRLVIAG